MSLLNVLIYPDEGLKKIATPVEKFDEELSQFIDDMFETMYHEQGIGLAATQVNVQKRVITIDIEGTKENQIELVNPEIIDSCGETGIEEGCLSLPGFNGFVPRKEKVKVKAYNRKGEEFVLEADGLLAICIQHEIDHLNGIVFADYLSPLKRQRMKDKLSKLQKQLAKQK
ncbi:peptide deformylase [Bisgaardia hudsonensis]|uniref:Peptide deformylase n=1 Tax=Bisgaardia hudsonensis TaxID=109472 RepID=A0A4R2MX00_9PAST|nr:peptide deformylase [Bisgaardia hudsonensis]QLB12222.1 peptide deformylase [Bisgaardia hudsonensis]TCP12265.1 peptide deformylase [Bisgaardia hudsonensis]